jgi:ribose transport system permease protein
MSVSTPSSTHAPASAPAGRALTLKLARLQQSLPLAQTAALIVVFAFGAATLDGFSDIRSVKSMLVLAAFLGLAALGQTIVVLLGGLDLSVVGFIALGDVLIAVLVGGHEWSFAAALVLILGISAVVGGLNGYLCARFKLQSIVVTIATGFVVIGVVQVEIANFNAEGVPEWLQRFSSVTGTTFGIGIPPLVVTWAVVAVIMGFVLSRTVVGRRIYQTGSNPVAADLALVRTRLVWTGAFAFSAVCAASVGILLAGFTGSADATVGEPYLFSSLAAVVVGGNSIIGARGDYWRTVLGALILTVLTTLLLGHGYGTGEQKILFGLAILVVVAAYGRDLRIRDRV